MLHASQYPDDAAAPPVPHASTWFDESSGAPRHLHIPSSSEPSRSPDPTQTDPHAIDPGAAGAAGPGGEADEADSDIEAVAERTSIRCPLTLLPMQEPVSTSKCPHSFERSAIMEYLGSAPRRDRTRAAPREAKCPVCEVVLADTDLRPDPILKRKIARFQAAEKRAALGHDDDDDDDDEHGALGHGKRARGPEEITSSSPVRGLDPDASAQRILRIKRERASMARRETPRVE